MREKISATYADVSNAQVGKYLYTIIVGIIFLLSFLTDWYIALARILLIVTILMVLMRLGKGIILRELIALHSIFVCIFMPTLGYTMFTKENALARLWVRFMPVSEDQYFSFALPAQAIFVIALCWPLSSAKGSDQGESLQKILNLAKDKLLTIPKMGLHLMIIGIVMSIISPYLPGFLQFVGNLVYWSSFSGVLYIYYMPAHKYKKLILVAFGLFLFLSALQGGMFTILVYMGITMFSFFFLGKKASIWKKLLIFIAGIFFIFMIQSVKGAFRKATWKMGYEGNKAVLFTNLVSEKLSSTASFLDDKSLFPFYYRTNQGFNIALVIRRFPNIQPHDNGRNLFRSFLSALVPRFLWPDKPEAGGKFNMQHYTGIAIKNWSTNVGPLGEAYGSFGRAGGILFMFVLGAFIRWGYARIFVIATRIPLLLFWIPVLFYQVTYSAETDTLQILNSLFKSAFFVWMLYKIIPRLFAAQKQSMRAIRTDSIPKAAPYTR